jgi:tetraacyldisaccharide 4'-kinase
MLRQFFVSFFERLFFKPNLLDWVFVVLLSPLSLLFALLMLLRRLLTSQTKYTVPIISIGNLTVGGSGKTPFVIQLAAAYTDVYIISRGYGRRSKGLVEVSHRGEILTNVFGSGDEPMLMAQSLPEASVIVSEDREVAIKQAIKQGAKVIFLDDGFNRVNIKKFDILLFPPIIKNFMPFPAGPFREFVFVKYFADLNVVEDRDFSRVVTVENPTKRMLLVTAISNPHRLDAFLPSEVVERIYLEDHAYFDESKLQEQVESLTATSLLVTQKDAVKMVDFKLPLSVMKLELQIENQIIKKIDNYIGAYYEE